MTDSNAHRNSRINVIDRDRLVSISDGEREFEIELLDAYIEDARDCLANIEVALVTNNWSTVAEVAHQLKGASGNVGALCMSELCTQLEQEALNCFQNGTVELLHQELEAVTEVARQW